MTNNPFAVFDIDGTLIRWQLYHGICDELARQKLIDPAGFEQVKAARMNWKRRTGEESFREYERLMIKVFDKALVGLSVADFALAADSVFEEYKEQVYTYTRDLIRELKSKGYLLLAISGAPTIILEKMASFYGFDDYAGTVFLSEGGKYTGEKELSVLKKSEVLNQLANKHDASFRDSLAVGDSE
ncbi:MAG: HAD family hydrolase, partial [Candidatus Saccharimonadales bacterium]